MTEKLVVGSLTFDVRRSARRKTLGLTVDRGGELLIHAPDSAQTAELSRWIQSKLLWVHKKLALKEAMTAKVREPEFVTGESFSYLGRSYRLLLVARQDQPLEFDGRRFSLRKDAVASASQHFRHWYTEVGTNWIQQRVAALTRKTGVVPATVDLRDLGFRWGSCGKGGILYFNWKVLQLPVRLIDYVIVHELAHLHEPYHGPAFWRAIDQAMPDWRVREERLKSSAQTIFWCRAGMKQ